jgi:hypothetical protein
MNRIGAAFLLGTVIAGAGAFSLFVEEALQTTRASNGPLDGSAREPSLSARDSTGVSPRRIHAAAKVATLPGYSLGDELIVTASSPRQVLIGDVTGDGQDDIVLNGMTWNPQFPSIGQVVVRTRASLRGEAEPIVLSIPETYEASSILLADMNNDAVKDIVVGHSRGLTVFTADGVGGFTRADRIGTYAGGPLAALDVDGDGYLDVAAAADTGLICYGNGQGAFRSCGSFLLPSQISDFAVGDVNGDGAEDLLVSSILQARLSIYINVGAARLDPSRTVDLPDLWSGANNAWNANGVVVGDFNGDGRNDVAVTRTQNKPTGIWMLYQDERGDLVTGEPLRGVDLPGDLLGVDVDNDGRKDLVTVHGGWATLSIHLQGASGMEAQAITYFAHVSGGRNGFAVGDMNGDGCKDIVVVTSIGVTMRYGSNCVPSRAPVVVNDVDGDGDTDMMWRNDARTDLASWLMDGHERVGAQGYRVGPQWNIIASGDFNGDGARDLVWSDGRDMQLWQRYGDGYQGWQMPAFPIGYRVVAAGDIDGDGNADLLWRDADNTVLALWTMDGPWVKDGRAYGLPASWRIAGTGDLNADGRLDLVVTNGVRMDLWKGQRNLQWESAAMGGYPVGWELAGTADIDGDGASDLLWRHAALGYFVQWKMIGPRRIWGREYGVDGAWRILSTGDYNRDGKADFVWTNGTLMQLWSSRPEGGYAGLEMPGYPRGWSLQE